MCAATLKTQAYELEPHVFNDRRYDLGQFAIYRSFGNQVTHRSFPNTKKRASGPSNFPMERWEYIPQRTAVEKAYTRDAASLQGLCENAPQMRGVS
ncbi:hypothetical protein NBRC116590_33070 [Pelagimonas sp. KU-00592-HH]